MKRRLFFKNAATASIGLGLTKYSSKDKPARPFENGIQFCVTVSENKLQFFSETIKEPIKIVHIADTHLFMDDERGDPYTMYSGRMAKAYNQTKHFKTGESTNPELALGAALDFAKESKADLITLIGDIFSFPSEAAIEWVVAKLKEVDIPYIYVAGNHDWHYEGMEGTLEDLRDNWIKERLLPLYQGNHPLMAAYDLKGIRFLAIDNSTYQINKEQLDFFKEQVSSEIPLVLLVHIPMYAPGKSIGFGCGNPYWGASSDQNFELERRLKWPEAGHSETTFNFHKAVFSAPNLMGIFSGHIHRFSIESIKGKPQIVTDDNASGGYLDVDFLPLEPKDKSLIF
ncbi:metallophosphoesterase family protein [Arenibacter echinorum]|uniref:Calcineurin-like phosphoesterase family protein n=1 Tax=Arenibacter echinorum TaxID=440515 RepID=A0A327QXM6_9FLAO|nr:metallophosphoesterase [Arenibacter echinorum]RAJ08143.1 calcineurin-like phosphoesterase family protein [Arenibacter echinorum]